jgi:hypothetical protein
LTVRKQFGVQLGVEPEPPRGLEPDVRPGVGRPGEAREGLVAGHRPALQVGHRLEGQPVA